LIQSKKEQPTFNDFS